MAVFNSPASSAPKSKEELWVLMIVVVEAAAAVSAAVVGVQWNSTKQHARNATRNAKFLSSRAAIARSIARIVSRNAKIPAGNLAPLTTSGENGF